MPQTALAPWFVNICWHFYTSTDYSWLQTITPGRAARASATPGRRFPSPESVNGIIELAASSEEDDEEDGDDDSAGKDEGYSRDGLTIDEQSEDEDNAPNPRTPARRTIPAADFTPYSPQPNSKEPSKSRWGDQSPDTQMILNLGSQLYVSDLMVGNPYPDEPTRVKLSNTQLVRAAELLGLTRRQARLKGDNQYLRDCSKMVRGFVGWQSVSPH